MGGGGRHAHAARGDSQGIGSAVRAVHGGGARGRASALLCSYLLLSLRLRLRLRLDLLLGLAVRHCKVPPPMQGSR